jgi:hypothetical protein
MAYTQVRFGNWMSKDVPLPPNGSAGVIFAGRGRKATAFLGYRRLSLAGLIALHV